MATITPGTGATITATTAEGQLVQIVRFLAKHERDLTKNPAAVDNVSWSFDEGTMEWSATWSILLNQTFDADTGATINTADEYLVGLTFTPGSGGTFKSPTAAQYLKQVTDYLQALERTQGVTSRVTGTTSQDTLIFSGSATFSMTEADSPDLTLSVVPYLT